MKFRKYYRIIIIGFILIFSSCFYPHRPVFYWDLKLPIWTDAHGIWSLDNERWLMRGFDTPNKRRDIEIMNKYLIYGALCYAVIQAKNETTVYSKNPYAVEIVVYGIKEIHTSFTIKDINVYQRRGNDLSYFINNELPITVLFKNESEESRLVSGYFRTEEMFIFKEAPVFIELNVEVHGTDNTETGKVFFELTPKAEFGLFIFPD